MTYLSSAADFGADSIPTALGNHDVCVQNSGPRDSPQPIHLNAETLDSALRKSGLDLKRLDLVNETFPMAS